jgi:hypothetical protein
VKAAPPSAPMFAAPKVVHARRGPASQPPYPLHAALPDDRRTLCGRRVDGGAPGMALAAVSCDKCRQWVAYSEAVGLAALHRQLEHDREHFRCCGAARADGHAYGCRNRK